MAAPSERADARANRQRIIQAALEVLAERGAAAEIKEVADRAGVGVGTIYRNFATKDDLLRGILDDVIEQYMTIYERALTTEDPVEGVKLYIDEMYAVLARWSPAVMAMLSGAFTDEIKQRFMAFLQDKRLEALFVRGIELGVFRKDLPVALARGLMVNICDPIVYLAVQSDMSHEQLTAGFTDLILRAVMQTPPPPLAIRQGT